VIALDNEIDCTSSAHLAGYIDRVNRPDDQVFNLIRELAIAQRWAVSPYRGCAHACRGCGARAYGCRGGWW
jgi:hypothetical protein